MCPLCPINYLYYVVNPDGLYFFLRIYKVISIIMNKDQYITKQLNLNSNIQQAEIERKWRVFEEEQAQMELAMRIAQNISSISGTSVLIELLYMVIDYMEDELDYVE
jgi:hypothetical protein